MVFVHSDSTQRQTINGFQWVFRAFNHTQQSNLIILAIARETCLHEKTLYLYRLLDSLCSVCSMNPGVCLAIITQLYRHQYHFCVP